MSYYWKVITSLSSGGSPRIRHWEAFNCPGLKLRIKSHGNTIDNVKKKEDGGLWPGYLPVDNGAQEDYDAYEIAETVPNNTNL